MAELVYEVCGSLALTADSQAHLIQPVAVSLVTLVKLAT